MGWPVAASQSCAVLSALPVGTALPSGPKATATTSSWCLMRRPDGPAGGRRPRAAPCVGAGRRDRLAVGAEGHGVDRALVFQGRPVGCADGERPRARRSRRRRR